MLVWALSNFNKIDILRENGMDDETVPHRANLSKKNYYTLTRFDGDWRDTWRDDEFLSMMSQKWRFDQVEESYLEN